jgi:hypothetical protein
MLKKLTYTDEMKAQDKLWEIQNEDFGVMEKLYNQIITEAKIKGFNGVTYIYSVGSEMLCQIFNSEEEKELADIGTYSDFDEVGYCKPLIEKLEAILNR